MIIHLAKNPYFTAKTGGQKFGCAFSTIQRAILKLEKMKMIFKVSEGKRDRVYCVKAILSILEEPTKLNKVCLMLLFTAPCIAAVSI